MTFIDLVRFAAGNLWRRKARTLLTVLGVFIGTACITIMVALSLGNLEQFNEQIMQNTNLTRIEVYSGGAQQGQLNDSAIESFKQIPHVRSATGMMSLPSYMLMGKYECGSSLTVVDPEAMDFEFMEGSCFPDTDALELVIGYNARENFYDPRDTGGYGSYYSYSIGGMDVDEEMVEEDIGPDVDWLSEPLTYWPNWGDPEDEEFTPENPAPKEYKARVCGILSQADDQSSYSIYISQKAAQRIFTQNRKHMQSMGFKMDTYDQAYVNVEDVDSVQGVLDTLKEQGYQCYSPTEWINDMREEQSRQQSQLVAIGMVSLLVSAIGIANTMLASILERRREIGVMKVLGLSVHKINVMFLVEAALIGFVGGVIGIGLSYALAGILASGQGEVSFLGMYFEGSVRMSIPWWLALGSIGIAVLVGVISGIYPAWKATRMSPLEAIRDSAE